jgi:membrane-bound lytic murein transglycosylase D
MSGSVVGQGPGLLFGFFFCSTAQCSISLNRRKAAHGPTFDQEIVLTADIRVILLAVALVLAGCMPAKKAQGPAVAVPGVSRVASTDAGRMQAPDAPGSFDAKTPEAPDQDGDVDPLDVLQDREEIPEADALSPEEQKILDTEISFHVGLDTVENTDVQRYFHYYTHTHRGTMDGWLKRAQLYLPHIRKRFIAEGLPEDLIYLPFAESGFNPFAVSRAGACGVWQFMPKTAVNFGLTVDSWVDERRDPYKSTEAAIVYLKKLYADFGDWSLALAAYNAGEGTIGRAMKKTGCEDYFSLCQASPELKEETKLYVPKFLALVKVARNLEKLGFEPLDMDRHIMAPVLMQAKPGTDFLGLAKNMGLDWKAFRELNPALRKQEGPPSRSVRVAVPGHLVAQAEAYLKRPVATKRVEVASYKVKSGDTWWGIARKHGLSVAALQQSNAGKVLKVGLKLRVPGRGANPQPAEIADTRKWASKRANYVVRQGDTIWSIAKQFRVDPATLLQTNALKKGSTLQVGQKLFVPDAGSAEVKVATAKAETVRQELVSYQVRSGDSLWNIAKKFGVTALELQQWNKLAENARIRPGDQLKVYSR